MRHIRSKAYSLLRRSERYFKTDMVYLTKGGFWLFLERAVAITAGFALSVAFANLMEPEKYGIYKYVISFINIAGAFSLTGMITAVNQASARGFGGALKTGSAAAFRWSTVAVLISFLGTLYYFSKGNEALGIALLVGGAFSPFIASGALYDNFLAGTRRFKIKAIYGSLRNAIPPIALVGGLFITRDPVTLIAVYFISTALVTAFCYFSTIKHFVSNKRTDNEMLPYAKHLSIMGIFSVIAAQIDRVLIFTTLGGTALAVYSFAEAIPDQLRSLNSVIGTLALPKLANAPIPIIKKTIASKVLMILLATIFIYVNYVLLAPWFFALFFPLYMESVLYSQVYALSLFAVPGLLFSQTFVAHMKTKELYIQRLVSSLSKIALLLTLIPIFGIWGAVYAVLGSYIIGGLLLWIQFHNLKEVR